MKAKKDVNIKEKGKCFIWWFVIFTWAVKDARLQKNLGFFFLQCPLPPYLYEPQKSIFVLFKSYKILPFATPWTFVLATHLRLKTVLQLLLHMSWLFVHKIEDNFLEILSPRFVDVLFNSFIIDISFRKQSKMALLKLSVKLMDFKTIVIFPMGLRYLLNSFFFFDYTKSSWLTNLKMHVFFRH